MARGWESKSVAAQIEARQTRSDVQSVLSETEIARRERRDALQLTRSRLVAQLARARAAAHKEMLTRSLAEIDRQLAELNRPLNTDV